jgi:hypothetical protein
MGLLLATAPRLTVATTGVSLLMVEEGAVRSRQPWS